MIVAALLAGAIGVTTVDLAAVGDIMLGRYVARRIAREGAHALFDAARPALDADLTFGNLECVLGDAPFARPKRFLLRGDPASASALAKAGFDVLSVANNHAVDAGEPGLRQTLRALEDDGVNPVGHRAEPTVVVRKGLRVAFLAITDFPVDPPGLVRQTDESTLAGDIADARRRADVVVVSWHWGTEGSHLPSDRQRRLARLAADAGADLVLGHHPHVLQPIEWLPAKDGRRCLVAYSLGNFVFDATRPAERQTLVLRATLAKNGVQSYATVPFRIRQGRPLPLTAPSARPRPRKPPMPPGSGGRTARVR
ncbi:MAG: CapA family protein [Fimbriimonadaceae bacterium]|nr:CapA family protein [Fimbriimonadaceae bacterium]